MTEVVRFPALFVSHGSPMVAVEEGAFARALESFARAQPRPRAVVVFSAHWETPGAVHVSSGERLPTIHDFGGFPEELYRIEYPASGAPALAREVADALGTVGLPARLDPTRGLDHGAWIPLRFLYRDASVPVVAVSLPRPRAAADLVRAGRALAPLRERGVLLLGSGGVVHNLRLVRFDDREAPVEGWARAFDEWVAERAAAGDVDGLGAYESGPFARRAVPSTEHLDPIFPVLGSAAPGEVVTTVFDGFEYGNLAMRCLAVGAKK